MKTIQVTLSLDGIEKAIKELNDYAKEVEQKTKLLVSNLTDLGADIARVKIVGLGAIDTGELLSSVSGYFDYLTNSGFVKVTNDHAAFVEFGTGVALDKKVHPNGEYLAKASWAYGSGETILTTKDGRIGWYYPLDDGSWRFTEGMESRPFMYETALELQREFPRIAQEVFSK